MSQRTRTTTATRARPEPVLVISGALQRRCACGTHTGGGATCSACAEKERTLQRQATNHHEPSEVSPMVYEIPRSPGQPVDPETRAFFEPRFGRDFSDVRVRGQILRAPSDGSGGEPLLGGPHGQSASRPLTAVPLEAARGSSECQVPPGRFGAAKALRYRLRDFDGHWVFADLLIAERFRRLEGPENAYQELDARKNEKTSAKGFFNDCYRLYAEDPLPETFRLKVEQRHLLNGIAISRNDITYTPNSVLLCAYRRPPGAKEFEARCKTF